MYAFLERCGVKTPFSTVLDYCIDTTYEGDYEWDAGGFERAFKKYVNQRNSHR